MYTECIIFPCISWKRSSLSFCPRKKYYIFGEKIPSFQIIQERSYPSAALFVKTIFSEGLKKISYFRIFFWERSSFIFRLRCKIIFSGKINIIFPDNTRKTIFQRIFLERPSFQDVWKKKIWFSVQCVKKMLMNLLKTKIKTHV